MELCFQKIIFQIFETKFSKNYVLEKIPIPHSLITVETIRISDKRAWHPLQQKEEIFSKKYFSKILDRIFEKLHFCIKMIAPLLLTVDQ